MILTMLMSMAACGSTATDTAPAAEEKSSEMGDTFTKAELEAAAKDDNVKLVPYDKNDPNLFFDPHDPAFEVTYPVTVTDMAGRTVTIEKEPQRIVSGYYISSSACIALGLTDRIVSVEEKAAKRPIYGLAAAKLIELPNVGSAKNFDLETCLAVEPDLVILPMKQKGTAQTLADMGIPALVVMPEDHEQILEMFELIATATNTRSAGNRIIDFYSGRLATAKAIGAAFTDKPVVYMAGTSSYLTTAPKDMYQASIIEVAGGINAARDIEGNSWTQISYEQLLAMDPDIIVVPTNSMANGSPDYTVDDILADHELKELKAVKNGAVYQMTTGFEAWDSPVPSGILGTMWMLKTLHPEAYGQDDFVEEVTTFYHVFYGFEVESDKIR